VLDATPARCENRYRSFYPRHPTLVTQPSPSEVHPVPKGQAGKAASHKLAKFTSVTGEHHMQVGQEIAWPRATWPTASRTVQTSGQ